MNKRIETPEVPIEFLAWYNATREFAISYLNAWDKELTEENIAAVIRRGWIQGEGYDQTGGLMLVARKAAIEKDFDVYQFIKAGGCKNI